MIGIYIGVSIGVNASNPITAIIASFQSRVAADGGVFEAPTCLEAQLTALNAIQ